MTTTTTARPDNNQFFEVRLHIFAGSNQRKTFDKDGLEAMGFKEVDFDEVKAMLHTSVLPKDAFYDFLAIRKAVQDFLSTKGVNHPLMGRVFSPEERIEIVEKLKEKQAEYNEARAEFLAKYSSYKAEQLAKVQATAEMKGVDSTTIVNAVKKNQPLISYYEKKLEFRFLDMSIQLDSEQWAEEIERINSDLVARTVYETEQDANKIRDKENPRTKASDLLSLASRLSSLNFYVPGLAALAKEIETLVENIGGVKPAKAYEAKEVLMLTGAAKVISQKAHALIDSKKPLAGFMDSEAARIEAMFADEEQETIKLDATVENTPLVDSEEVVETQAEEDNSFEVEDIIPAVSVKVEAPSHGVYNF